MNTEQLARELHDRSEQAAYDVCKDEGNAYIKTDWIFLSAARRIRIFREAEGWLQDFIILRKGKNIVAGDNIVQQRAEEAAAQKPQRRKPRRKRKTA